MDSTMTVLKVMPGCKPERKLIPHALDAMQSMVCGYIQAIYPYEDSVAIICNEEGNILDIISGTFFICGLSSDDFCSLTEEQLKYYSEMFYHPEVFFWNGHNLVVLQMA